MGFRVVLAKTQVFLGINLCFSMVVFFSLKNLFRQVQQGPGCMTQQS